MFEQTLVMSQLHLISNPIAYKGRIYVIGEYSGIALIQLWFNLNIALNRTKFEVPGQALYKSIESLSSVRMSIALTGTFLEEHIILKCTFNNNESNRE